MFAQLQKTMTTMLVLGVVCGGTPQLAFATSVTASDASRRWAEELHHAAEIEIELPAIFARDSAELRETADRQLDELARFLRGVEGLHVDIAGEVTGVERRRVGATLCQLRAAVVHHELLRRGLSDQHVTISDQMCADGRGRGAQLSVESGSGG